MQNEKPDPGKPKMQQRRNQYWAFREDGSVEWRDIIATGKPIESSQIRYDWGSLYDSMVVFKLGDNFYPGEHWGFSLDVQSGVQILDIDTKTNLVTFRFTRKDLRFGLKSDGKPQTMNRYAFERALVGQPFYGTFQVEPPRRSIWQRIKNFLKK